MEYKHLKLWLSCCWYLLLSFDVFVPTIPHPFIFFDKCFVQIYLLSHDTYQRGAVITCPSQVVVDSFQSGSIILNWGL
jgi:hypothetical protein